MPTGPTPLDKNPPGSNQHPLSSKEEARASDKEKPRMEDGGLDGVAARTAPEHVAVKQEPHIPSVSGAAPDLTWAGERGARLSLSWDPTSSVLLWGPANCSWTRRQRSLVIAGRIGGSSWPVYPSPGGRWCV